MADFEAQWRRLLYALVTERFNLSQLAMCRPPQLVARPASPVPNVGAVLGQSAPGIGRASDGGINCPVWIGLRRVNLSRRKGGAASCSIEAIQGAVGFRNCVHPATREQALYLRKRNQPAAIPCLLCANSEHQSQKRARLICSLSGQHVVSRQRAANALKCKIANWFNRYILLNCHQHAGLIRIWPGFASSHSRDATLDTVPMAA